MAYTLGNKYAENLCKRIFLLQLIIENVVTCFFGTQCRWPAFDGLLALTAARHVYFLLYFCAVILWRIYMMMMMTMISH